MLKFNNVDVSMNETYKTVLDFRDANLKHIYNSDNVPSELVITLVHLEND